MILEVYPTCSCRPVPSPMEYRSVCSLCGQASFFGIFQKFFTHLAAHGFFFFSVLIFSEEVPLSPYLRISFLVARPPLAESATFWMASFSFSYSSSLSFDDLRRIDFSPSSFSITRLRLSLNGSSPPSFCVIEAE